MSIQNKVTNIINWNNFKKILLVIFLLFITAALVYTLFLLIKEIKLNNGDVRNNFTGGFFGAFFALIILIIQQLFSKWYIRNKNNHNNLVSLERKLGDLNIFLHNNKYLMKELIKQTEKGYSYSCLFDFPILDSDLLIDISNIDLINDTRKLFYNNNKMTSDLKLLSSAYLDLTKKFHNKEINNTEYNLQTKVLIVDFTNLKEYIDVIIKENLLVLKKINILFKEQSSSIDWLIRVLSNKTNYPKKLKKICEEDENLLKNMDKTTRDKARKRKEEIMEKLSKSNNNK